MIIGKDEEVENFGDQPSGTTSNEQEAKPQRAPSRTRVGVVVVHGIGEQRRFEHVDAQVREIVRAIQGRDNSEVTVEVYGGSSSSFLSDQDSRTLGDAAVKATVRSTRSGDVVQIHFHEVWWADSNEPYSFFKQLRFWGWGLAIAFIPMKLHSSLASARSMRDPEAPGANGFIKRIWVRARLYGVSFVAALGAGSVGLLTFLAKRILNLEPPDVIKVFVNYVAGVKLYNQKSRWAGGFPAENADFLDAMGEPPRVTVRRRMIRALAQAASANYDRWYVLSHSLGTVVALNGLMESAAAWPGYFDEPGWQALIARNLAGSARGGWKLPTGDMSPKRPVWCADDQIAYRSAIFSRLHGIIMMGTPLEKFATLWPGRVPISTEPAFRKGTTWISLYDPLDPVSGVLRGFDSINQHHSPQPETIGYAADSKLFVSHIRYLKWRPNEPTLADAIAHWLITGRRDKIGPDKGSRWFDYRSPSHQSGPTPAPNSWRHRRRTAGAWLWWLTAVLILTLLGALSLPPLIGLMGKAVNAIGAHVHAALHPEGTPPPAAESAP